jgi:hypothetical protein
MEMTPDSKPPDFAPDPKSVLAQVTKLSIIELRKRPITLVVAARKSNIPKLFFIKIGKCTKGSSALRHLTRTACKASSPSIAHKITWSFLSGAERFSLPADL